MRAAVLEKINVNPSIKDVQLTDLKFGQVLVRNLVSGICGSQLHEIRGNKGNAKFLPHLMGHEGCGIVESVGLGVVNVSVGDKVVMHWRPAIGIESEFPMYILNGSMMSSGKVTTLSEYSIVSENRLTKVPNDINEEFAALLGCSLTTAFGLINNEVDIKFGESVMVVGSGGVGLNVLQAAELAGAGRILAVDVNDKKRMLAIANGATEYLNYDELMKVNDKIDIIIDTTGIPDVISMLFKYLSGSGRMALIGQTEPGESIVIPNALSLFNGSGQRVFATQGGASMPHVDIPRYTELYVNGRISIDDLVTHRFALDDVSEAFDLLKTGDAGRIMIKIAEA